MKKNLLKTLLVGLMTLAATSAWAADKTVVKYSFDDAMSPSLTAGSRVSFDYDKTSVITSTKFLNAYNNTNGDPGSSTVSLGSTDLSGETWTLSFEWAACGGCNSKADHTILKAGDTNLFDLTGNSNWNTTVTITYAGSDGTKTLPVPGCDKGKRFSAATGDQLNTEAYWHHIVVTGSADGVKMTITNSSTGTAVVENVVLSETNVNPTSLIIEPCCGGAIGIDELSLTYYVEGEVVQTPVANYSAVDGISRTITATCDTEGATLYYSTDGENWTEGASVTVSESGKVYFKAVKGTAESDVLEFDAEAGEAIVLNAPVINRTTNTSVTISCDQTGLLLSPTATVYYTYGEESGSFTGSITLTVAADATITAYAEAEGYTTSETSERAVALFPTFVETLESIDAKTSGWSENAFSTETITASERTYAALMLDGVQWGQNVYLQTGGAWGLRASGNWYINSATDESWMLMQNMKKGDIIVANVTYPASSMVNATFSKYTYGTRQAYEVTEDGDVELAFKKPNASEMDYLYGVYAYREVEVTPKNIYLAPAIWDVEEATERYAAYAFNSSSVYEWYDFAAAGEEGIFTAAVPDFYKNIILVRMNGETTENIWENKWNQTEDIDFTAVADNTLFTITGWGEGDDAKSTYETSEYVEPIVETDIDITVAEGDIAAALAAATEGKEVRNITIRLNKEATYTVSAPLVAYKNFEIQANGATIDANELTGNFIEMATTEDPTVTVPVEFVSIHNATVKGLKKPLFYSSQKGYLIEWLTIDNSIIEVAADATSIDFTKGSAVRNFNIENSTVYAPVATTKSFYSSQAGQKLTELDEEGTQTFIIKNSTMYNLATGKNFFTHRQSNQKWLAYTVENSLFVNCGKSGQVIKGMNGGQSGTNPTWTITGNAFNFEVDGVMTDTSAAEDTGDTTEGEGVQNSVAGVVTFTDAANGDFNGEFQIAEGATAPEALGDGRWTIIFKGGAEVETTYYLVGNMNEWTPAEGYQLTRNEDAGEGVEEYMISLDLAADAQFKVVKVEGENPWIWYPDGENNNYGQNGELTAAGKYNVYFRPNGDGGSDWFYNVLYVVDATTDGINSILAEAVENGKVYNLQGQKVQKTQKGLFIVNGKKVVMK